MALVQGPRPLVPRGLDGLDAEMLREAMIARLEQANGGALNPDLLNLAVVF